MAASANCSDGKKSKTHGVQTYAPVTIVKHLEDIIVYEGKNAVLECKINGTPQPAARWYKDGVEILKNQRVKIVTEKKWLRLEIDSVLPDDHGLYNVVIKNKEFCIFSSANIYVGLPERQNAVLYSRVYPKWYISLVKELRNVTVDLNSEIVLEVQYSDEAVSDIIWYKSDRVIIKDSHVDIKSTLCVSRLSIENAKETDTGVYTVVSRTKCGTISSTANVQVIDGDLSVYHCEVPQIYEYLPEEVELNEGEDLKLMCNVKIDNNTIIQWFKDGRMVDNRSQLMELSGCNYAGLRIAPVTPLDNGEYTVAFQNKISGKTDSSTCHVTVHPQNIKSPPTVLLRKSLTSAMVYHGSSVLFNCCFELGQSKYFYVVWYVGKLRVERSNTRFNVVCKDGDYLLQIKKVETCMAGEVVCELRYAYPTRGSLIIGDTTCVLSIVPPEILIMEKRIAPINPWRHPTVRSLVPNPQDEKQQTFKHPFNVLFVREPDNATLPQDRPTETLLEMNYCRLEDDDFYYLDITWKAPQLSLSEVTVREKYCENTTDRLKTFVVEWTEPYDINLWYAIDLMQKGVYIEAGISSRPVFQIMNPQIGCVIGIRIRTADPLPGIGEASIVIAPLKSSQNPIPERKICELKDMENFGETYQMTSHVIGSGAFGSVNLVTNNYSEEYYAAKCLKTRTQKKRNSAFREFQIMKDLKHPKVVDLVDAYSGRDSFTLVMEFLWGGELFTRIVEEEHIKETDVVPYVKQICEALEYLHEKRIAHMDLKPENIICLNPNSRQVKLVDFGLARVLTLGEITKVIYGTKDYVAPEVLNFEGLTVSCDMWSLGVVTYMLLSGVMPFQGNTWPIRSANITKANYNFDETAFKDISDLAKDFITQLLVLNPSRRMTATQALDHKWIIDGPPQGAQARHMKRTRDNLKSFLATYRARWQRAGNVMIAAHRLRTQVSNRSSMERTSPGT